MSAATNDARTIPIAVRMRDSFVWLSGVVWSTHTHGRGCGEHKRTSVGTCGDLIIGDRGEKASFSTRDVAVPHGREGPRDPSLRGDSRDLEDQPGDRRRHEAHQRAREQRPQTEPGEVGLAARSETADAADLDADRGE